MPTAPTIAAQVSAKPLTRKSRNQVSAELVKIWGMPNSDPWINGQWKPQFPLMTERQAAVLSSCQGKRVA